MRRLLLLVAAVTGCQAARPTSPAVIAVPSAAREPAPSVVAEVVACSSAQAGDARESRGSTREELLARPIVRVEVKGHQRVAASSICAVITTKAGAPVDESTLDADLRRVFQLGMDDVAIDARAVRGGGTELTFTVRERPLLSVVTVTGKDADARALFAPFENKPLDIEDVKVATAKAREQLVRRGHRSARVEYELTPLPMNEVKLEVTVEPGPRTLLSALRIVGARGVAE